VAKKEIKKNYAIQIKNKRAEFDFLLLDQYTAGIVLTGTEIKSIRQGKASLVETFCYIRNGEIWVKNMYIAHYQQGSYNNHVERRDRKLLLTKKEIRKLLSAEKNPGFSIVPTLMYINENGLCKVDIYLCRGKKEYDKRETLKAKQDRRDIDRAFKRSLPPRPSH